MRLEQLAFEPRPRSAQESLDLGLALLQAHRGRVLAVLALQVAVIGLPVLALTGGSPLWALGVLWWMKPIFNEGTLFVLSRAAFGERVGPWAYLRGLRSAHGAATLPWLLWRRFSLFRAATLPVGRLEGLRGATRRARCRGLLNTGLGTAFGLTVATFVFQLLVVAGFYALLQAMRLPGTDPGWLSLQGNPRLPWLGLGTGVLALGLIEPFYQAAGFGLYLSRRASLEAWDLELAFRRLATRVGRGLVLLLLLGTLPVLRAQDPLPAEAEVAAQEAPRPDSEARRTVQRLMEEPALRRTERRARLRYAPTGREPRWLRAILDSLFGREREPGARKAADTFDPAFLKALAPLLRILLIGALVALCLWLLIRHAHRLVRLPQAGEPGWEAPEAVAGLDIRPESLPEDIPAEASRAFAAGRVREALALLYRGALAILVHDQGLEIPSSATEGDALRLAGRVLEASPLAGFRALTAAWQRAAYLGEMPEGGAFEALIQGWRRAFGGRRP